MKQNVKIILASGSPRRKELFEQVGLTFSIMKSNAEERITKTNPKEVVMELAAQKAGEVLKQLSLRADFSEEILIVGADTIVVSEGKILGKPRDEKDALEILMSLSGREHSVFTGVCGIYIDKNGKPDETKNICLAEETAVVMYPFSEEDAKAYIRTREPMDKAGAYGIQGIGAVLVKEIRGDYCNVVGFPLAAFVRLGCQKNFFRL
jgi:septum formation protein